MAPDVHAPARPMMPGHIQELAPVETAREKFERERLSRRAALRKIGMTTAMSVFALFSVDDLARMVGKALERQAGDNQVAEQVAKEFRQAGVALASVGDDGSCQACWTRYFCEMSRRDSAPPLANPSANCADDALYEYERCRDRHCSSSGEDPSMDAPLPKCGPRPLHAASP